MLREKNIHAAAEAARANNQPFVFFDEAEIAAFTLAQLPFLGDEVPDGWRRALVNRPDIRVVIYTEADLENFRNCVRRVEALLPDETPGYALVKTDGLSVEIGVFWKATRPAAS